MQFSIQDTINFLARTPSTLDAMLRGLPKDMLMQNEGPNTWSAYDVLGHLIHGEKTDWIPRMRIILSDLEDKTFEPFDRFVQLNASGDQPIEELLDEFRVLREQNLKILEEQSLTAEQLQLQGMHPDFGAVCLKDLLATWAVRDGGHIAQISRVLAKQYKQEVGPWRQYLTILGS